MNLSLDQVISLATSLFSLGSVIYLAAGRIAKLEVKVDTMWDFQMRRAFSEAVERGLGRANSPLHFDSEHLKALEPLKPDLVQWWKHKGEKLPDPEALLDIEANFGDRLLHQVCIPRGLTHGACLLMALSVAQQTEVLHLKLFSAKGTQ